MTATIIVGGFFGDEGKGKIISYLALHDNPSIVVRGGVGPNAGHTIIHNGKTYKVRMIPSGFINTKTQILIGPGVLINPDVLINEIEQLNVHKRISIDQQCGIIENKHLHEDSSDFLKNKIGSTGTGTGPANSERVLRTLKLARDVKSLSTYVSDVPYLINSALDKNKIVLIEGTQGTYLSLWHGTYPFVTSKDITASSICADIGIGPKRIDDVIVVFKSYVTRVGEGPLNNELSYSEIQSMGFSEHGTVTGRQRRAAKFDIELAKRAIMLNSATQIAITKLDILFPDCLHTSTFNDLSAPAKLFIKELEDALHVPITLIGTGPNLNDMIDLRDTIKN